MLSFKQFLIERASYKVFCDLDGVLVDFIAGVKKEINVKTEPSQSMIDEFLSTYYAGTSKFWAELPWKQDGPRLWNTLKDLRTEILSACPQNCKLSPEIVRGKRKWVKKHLGLTNGVNITNRKAKKKFVGPKYILIDDYAKNVNEWRLSGGIGIVHTSASNTLKELKRILLG